MHLNGPRVTVYITCYNYGRFLGDAIESVLRQSMDDWELIIVNDGSSDNTEEVLSSYEHHPKIQVIRTKNIGLPAASNRAIDASTGDYVMRLDADDFLDENILLVLAKYLDNHRDVQLVFSDYFLIDGLGNVLSQNFRRRLYDQDHVMDVPPNGACALVRREAFLKLGGYREDLGAQDGLDLWTKLRGNFIVANVNLPLYYYRRHGLNLTQSHSRILAAKQTIKMAVAHSVLDSMRPIVAVIPARRHFDFTSNLWGERVGGETLLERAVRSCLDTTMIDRVIVSCDNSEASELVAGFDANLVGFHQRAEKLTLRSSPLSPTIHEALKAYGYDDMEGTVVVRYIQTPFVGAKTIEESIATLAINDVDSAYGVEKIRRQLLRRSPYGLTRISELGLLGYEYDEIYQDTQTVLATKMRNVASGSMTGPSSACFEVSSPESFFIDTRDELEIAMLIESNFR